MNLRAPSTDSGTMMINPAIAAGRPIRQPRAPVRRQKHWISARKKVTPAKAGTAPGPVIDEGLRMRSCDLHEGLRHRWTWVAHSRRIVGS